MGKREIRAEVNKNTTYENLWDVPMAELRGKSMAVSIFIRKEQSSHINKLGFHFSKVGKQKSKLNPNLSESQL